MLFNSLPKSLPVNLLRHLFSWVLIGLMAAIYIYVPSWVMVVHDMVYSYYPQRVPTLIERAITQWWPYAYYSAPFIVLVFQELAGGYYNSKRVSRDQYPREYAMLEEVSKAAGLWWTPKLIIKDGEPNAAATRSMLFGRKVILMKDILELPDEQLEAVIAHEVAHLKNRDVLLIAPLGTMHTTLGLHSLLIRSFGLLTVGILWLLFNSSFWIILLAAGGICLALTIFSLLLGMKNTGGEGTWLGGMAIAIVIAIVYISWDRHLWLDAAFSLVATFVVIAAGRVFDVLLKTHSRQREYLADASAIAYLGSPTRKHLASALVFLDNWYARKHRKAYAKSIGNPLLRSHPLLGNRLKAINAS